MRGAAGCLGTPRCDPFSHTYVFSGAWVDDSYAADEWLAEEPYELKEEFPAAEIARLDREKGTLVFPLTGVTMFVAEKEKTAGFRENARWLLTLCGATLTKKSDARIHYSEAAGPYVGDAGVTTRAKIAGPQWLIEVICNRARV